MPRIRQDNDARYALRASFVDENGAVLESPIVIGSSNDPRISDTQIANWDTAFGWGDHASAGYAPTSSPTFTGDVVINGTTDDLTVSGTNPQIKWNTTTAGDTDYWWHLGSTGIFYCLADRTGDGAWEAPYPIQMDAASNYIQFYGSALIQPVTGNYGSFQIDAGATGSYEGYSIGGRAVFMHNNSTTTGLYNDVNNHWLIRAVHNDASYMYHAGTARGYTYSSGYRVTGNLLATSDVYAYYSDERLKDVVGRIEKPLESIGAIDTFYYTHNDKARELGYEGSERQVGVSAQSVQAVLPEVIGRAPIDDDGEGGSVTGEDYITVQYHRIVPLLIEGIKELTSELESVKLELEEIRDGGH